MTTKLENPASKRPRARLDALGDRWVARRLRSILCLDDFEPAARRILPRPLFGYVAGAAETNAALSNNRAAYAAYGLVPRTLVDASGRHTRKTLLGRTWSRPFGIPPMGLSALMAYRGDIVLAKAARRADIPMILSATSLIPLEEVAEVSPGGWFQAYLPGNERRIDAMMDRVEAAGYETFVLTVDVAVTPNRENNVRNGFSTPLKPSLRLAFDGAIRPEWTFGTLARTILRHGMPHFENGDAARGAPVFSRNAARNFEGRDALAWPHFERMRRRWKGKFVVKGILHAGDAVRAVESGADAIVLSNHGGRQLDGALSGLTVLPEIRQAIGRTAEIIVDGGIRRGTDVMKALALGADFALVGRPFLYAAAIGGEAGVDHAVGLLSSEIERNMALIGITSLDQLDESHVRRLGGQPIFRA